MPRIGLIGLGTIGRFYAINLLKAYGKISVLDINEARMREFERPFKSPKLLAQCSDIVILALPSPEAVENVVLGSDGVLSGAGEGCIILDLSTVGPDTSIEIAKAAAQRGVYYLDAPISGGQPHGAGTEGARNATVTFMVGGDEKAFNECKSVLEKLGKKIFYLGPSGMGSTVKLLSNLVNGIENIAMAEAFALGAAVGLDPKVIMKVFDETDADSYYLQEYLKPRFIRKDFEPGFTLDLMFKDHKLAGELANKLGVPLLLNELALQVYKMARAQGLGKKDYTAVVQFWAQLSGVDLYSVKRKRTTSLK